MKQGWKTKKLKEVCAKITDGTHQTPKYFDDGVIFLSSKNVTSGKIDWENIKYIDEKQHLEMHKRVAPRVGDILLAKNGTTGVAAMVDRDLVFDIYVSLAHIRVLEEVTPEYMLHFINSPVAKKQFNKRLKGSGVPNLHLEEIREVEIMFPPLPEQQRIVAILDTAFAAIDKAKTNAEQNLKNAKELFESYLQGVFENKGDGWVNRRLGESDLIEIIDGDRGKNYPTLKNFTDEGFCLFMNTKNVRPDGFMFNTTMFINEAKDKAMGKGKLKRNDVVMTTRGTIGNLGIYNEEVEFDNIRINSGMLIFRPNLKQITSEYLFEILRSGIIKEQIRKQVTGAAQPQLPIKTLVNFIFPVPKSLKQQETIVQKLDALSAETKKLEAIYQQKIKDLEELKKSVLQKAFSGELK